MTDAEAEILLFWSSDASSVQFSSVQLLSRIRLFATPWIAACQAFLSITNSQSLFKLMSIELMMPSKHLILCHLLLLPSIFTSYGVFSNESFLHIRWPKYWSFSFKISPANEYSFIIDWFDLLTGQGTLKSLLQHPSSRASILWCLAFFVVQLSHPYWMRLLEKSELWLYGPSVNKVMSLLFNMLSRFIIAFLPKNKCLLLSWLQSPSAVILEPKKMKSNTVYTFSPSICHEVIGPDAMILVFQMFSFKPAFSLCSCTFIKRLFSPLHFLPLECCHLHISGCWYFSWQSWFQLVIHLAWHFTWCTLYRS